MYHDENNNCSEDIYYRWNEANWDTLTHALSQNKCILMLGPEAATLEVDGELSSLSRMLAGDLAKKSGLSKETIGDNIDLSDPAQVCQFFEYDFLRRPNRIGLESEVCKFYRAYSGKTNQLHRNLAALPFKFIVSTGFDDMMAAALSEAGKKPRRMHYDFKGTNPSGIDMGSPEKPLIYNLYGDTTDSASMVLTENDLLDFLVAVISANSPLPENVLTQLRHQSNCFLLVGFGFRNWYLRILFHMLKVNRKDSFSFALEGSTPKYAELCRQLKQTVYFFQGSAQNLHICHQDFDVFSSELRRRFEEINKEEPVSIAPASYKYTDRAPEVFISYCSENIDESKMISNGLKSAGIKTWRDKENLRGGDDWKERMKSALADVDYVVVLNSRQLCERIESVVFEEVIYALERKRRFHDRFNFIIPVKIDDQPLYEKIDHLHYIKMEGDLNLTPLIEAINKDWQLRNLQ